MIEAPTHQGLVIDRAGSCPSHGRRYRRLIRAWTCRATWWTLWERATLYHEPCDYSLAYERTSTRHTVHRENHRRLVHSSDLAHEGTWHTRGDSELTASIRRSRHVIYIFTI